jgi:hypothetical protein
MIRVYYLKAEIKDNTECCIGQQYIHDAILGIAGILRKLIQDTTEPEHNGLIKATKEESEQLSMGTEYTSTPVRDLAKEIDDLKSRLGKLEAAKVV